MITLTVISFNDAPHGGALSARFDEMGGAIGRAESNQLVLPDPERTISRVAAQVVFRNGQYAIVDRGSNPITVNGKTLGSGRETMLQAGDQVRIGGYVIGVAVTTGNTVAAGARGGAAASGPGAAADSAAGLAAFFPAGSGAGGNDPFADLLGPAAAPAAGARGGLPDPLAAMQRQAAAAPPSATTQAPARPGQSPATAAPAAARGASPPAAAAAAASGIPETWDPFAPPTNWGEMGARKPAVGGIRRAGIGLDTGTAAPAPLMSGLPGLGDSGSGKADSLDALFGLKPGGTGSDPLAASKLESAASLPNMAGDSDPMRALNSAPRAIAATEQDALSDLQRPFIPQTVISPPNRQTERHAEGQADAAQKPAAIPVAMPSSTPNPRPGALDTTQAPNPLAAMVESTINASSRRSRPPVAGLDPLAPSQGWGAPAQPPAAGLAAEHAGDGRAATPDAVLSWSSPPKETSHTVINAPSLRRPIKPAPSADALAQLTPQPMPSLAPAAEFPRTEKPAARELPAAAASQAGVESQQALLAAFMQGLGIKDSPMTGLTPEFMRLVGGLLREATAGTVDLLVARAAMKRELRADATMIVARDNNPLKFSPSAEAALQHLLSPPVRGFMPAAEAMRDAYDDLRAHQFAFVAGMQAALEGVLERFDPKALEGQLSKASVLSTLLPGSRKAKMWDVFVDHYTNIREQASDDFHTLFGQAFLKAYEQQLDLLQPSNTQPGVKR